HLCDLTLFSFPTFYFLFFFIPSPPPPSPLFPYTTLFRSYLASLADGMPRVSNIEYYARIVKEKAILRNLIHATHDIQQRAFEGEEGADAILDGAESSIFALAEDRVRAGLIPVKDIVRDNFERLERIFKEGKSVTGVPTAYTELDKLTSGLQPSEVLILAARPSQGKTALALNLMEN